MFDRINILKEKGYYPSVIFDIGAYHGNWTYNMKNIYPEQKYYLFEGINYSELDRFNNDKKVVVYKNILLNDKVDDVDWYEAKNTGDSFFMEKSKHFINIHPTKRKTIDLDTVILRDSLISNDDNNIFIKIDCQGAEIPILKGATSILNKTDFILLEIPMFGQYNQGVPNFLEHITFMENIGFVTYDIVDKHYINGFNMQIDILFINKSRNVYNNFMSKGMLHSVFITPFMRKHVINYVNKKKENNQNYRVLDIGGSANSWSSQICNNYVDLFPPNLSNVTFFKFNINYENDWEILFDDVKKNGKFDFCICSHILEDIALPQITLNNLNRVAKEGFIGVPSKYRELSNCEGKWLGYIHHRWIYSIKNNNFVGFPKLNFIEHSDKLKNIGNNSHNKLDLSLFWKNDIPYSIVNNDYMGPNVDAVINYYDELINDDIDTLNNFISPKLNANENLICLHIEQLKDVSSENINTRNFILLKILIEDIIQILQFMKNINFVPFDIQRCDTNLELKILFINEKHKFNTDVNELLYT